MGGLVYVWLLIIWGAQAAGLSAAVAAVAVAFVIGTFGVILGCKIGDVWRQATSGRVARRAAGCHGLPCGV